MRIPGFSGNSVHHCNGFLDVAVPLGLVACRRATAVQVAFEVFPVEGSNIQAACARCKKC